jgi:hypothetical protein
MAGSGQKLGRCECVRRKCKSLLYEVWICANIMNSILPRCELIQALPYEEQLLQKDETKAGTTLTEWSVTPFMQLCSTCTAGTPGEELSRRKTMGGEVTRTNSITQLSREASIHSLWVVVKVPRTCDEQVWAQVLLTRTGIFLYIGEVFRRSITQVWVGEEKRRLSCSGRGL